MYIRTVRFVSGRVPFIKCGAFVVAELDPIISFVNNKVIEIERELKKWVQFP
jgi:metaxin